MSDFVWQTANLAGFISGCYTDDLDMIHATLDDVVIEPQRQALIPGFPEVRKASMAAGALGCSISVCGALRCSPGPSNRAPKAVRDAMKAEFAKRSIEVDDWIVDINDSGARVLPETP
ncbi:MAG: hypothetical protein WDO56_03660 [Gammaproteobacteria bacterium]